MSECHRGICKYIRNSHPAIKHFFDQWHVIKGIVKKKMLKATREKGCERMKEWTKGVIYWISAESIWKLASYCQYYIAFQNHLF